MQHRPLKILNRRTKSIQTDRIKLSIRRTSYKSKFMQHNVRSPCCIKLKFNGFLIFRKYILLTEKCYMQHWFVIDSYLLKFCTPLTRFTVIKVFQPKLPDIFILHIQM